MSAGAPDGAEPDAPVGPAAPARRPRRSWLVPGLLFAATAASMLFVGEAFWGSGWQLACPLLAILVAHEFGHFLAARAHGEDPTLPYFLPLPWGNPFGTLGAVLLLDDRRRSRKALLDIGAAGPLAGLAVALPLLALGLSLSVVEPTRDTGYAQEGQSLVYWLAKRLVLGPIPTGHDVTMHPVLGAAWAGLFITFLNLLPVGQLDGGHVARALLGPRQVALARWLTFLPGVLVVYNLVVFTLPWGSGAGVERAGSVTLVSAILPWAMLQVLLGVMRWGGSFDHPDLDDGDELDPLRRWIGGLTLAGFVLLFMPSPWVVH